MAWVKSPLSFPNIVSIVYSGEVSGINSKRSIPVTKNIHRQNGPQPKIKKCNIFGCPYNFFYNHESNRYDIDNKKTSVSVICWTIDAKRLLELNLQMYIDFDTISPISAQRQNENIEICTEFVS